MSGPSPIVPAAPLAERAIGNLAPDTDGLPATVERMVQDAYASGERLGYLRGHTDGMEGHPAVPDYDAWLAHHGYTDSHPAAPVPPEPADAVAPGAAPGAAAPSEDTR